MYYTIVPFEVLYQGIDKITNDDKFELKYEDKIFTLKKNSNDEVEIVSIFSTNPYDYLNPDFMPGKKIKIQLLKGLYGELF